MAQVPSTVVDRAAEKSKALETAVTQRQIDHFFRLLEILSHGGSLADAQKLHTALGHLFD